MLFLAIRSQILHSFSCPGLILHSIGSERAWSLHAPFPHEEQCLHCPVFWLALCWICVSDVWALPVSVAELKPNSSRVRNSLCPDVTSLYVNHDVELKPSCLCMSLVNRYVPKKSYSKLNDTDEYYNEIYLLRDISIWSVGIW